MESEISGVGRIFPRRLLKNMRPFFLCGCLVLFLAPTETFADAKSLPGMVLIPSANSMKGFYIDKFEVTQKEFEKLMGDNSSFFRGKDLPVENVTWFEAGEYCEKSGKRLPTEMEWERAAAAGSSTKYYWGDSMDDRFAWYKGNSDKQTHPIGQKKPNRFGLYDMSGNVWEWTSSDHESSGKVLRGGSWRNSPIALRSLHRIMSLPHFRYHYVGFRCAISDSSN